MSASPWWRLGLSGAKILRYRRVGERPRAHAPDPWASECNTSGRELFLPHNRGFDAAALWDYCHQYYDRLPAMLVFTHHEVPTDWHTSCEASLTRTLLMYRAFARGDTERASHIATLTAPQWGPDTLQIHPNQFSLRGLIPTEIQRREGRSSAPGAPTGQPWYGRGRRLAKKKLHGAGPEIVRRCMDIVRRHLPEKVRAKMIQYERTVKPPVEALSMALSGHARNGTSCCVSFTMPAVRIRRYPRRMYAELRDLSMDPAFPDGGKYAATQCAELLVPRLFADASVMRATGEMRPPGQRASDVADREVAREAAQLMHEDDVAREVSICELHLRRSERARRNAEMKAVVDDLKARVAAAEKRAADAEAKLAARPQL